MTRSLVLAAVVLTATAVTTLADIQGGSINTNNGGSVYTRGYFRSSGTYVAPSYRSRPDSSFYNNWSSYPNMNPYTGEAGSRRHPTPSYRSHRYGR